MNHNFSKYVKFQPDDRQTRRIMRMFLESKKGMEFTCVSIAIRMNVKLGIRIDHHDWSDFLDELSRTTDLLTMTGLDSNRCEKYLVN